MHTTINSLQNKPTMFNHLDIGVIAKDIQRKVDQYIADTKDHQRMINNKNKPRSNIRSNKPGLGKEAEFVEFKDTSPPLVLDTPLMGMQQIPMKTLATHIMVLGRTGVGKTTTVVNPLVRACAFYKDELGEESSLFIFDKKREIEPHLRGAFKEKGLDQSRIIEIGAGSGNRVNLYEFHTLRPNENKSSLAKRKSEILIELVGREISSDIDSHWSHGSRAIALNAFESEALIQQKNEFEGHKTGLLFQALNRLLGTYSDSDFEKLSSDRLLLELRLIMDAALPIQKHSFAYIFEFLQLIQSLPSAIKLTGELIASYLESRDIEQISFMRNFCDDEHAKQIGYYAQVLQPIKENLLAGSLIKSMITDPITDTFDLSGTLNGRYVSIRAAMDSGKILVYRSPADSTDNERQTDLVMKNIVLNAIRGRSNKVKPVFIIFDECHSIYSAQGEFSESMMSSYCRAYRACMILSTQSVSALKVAASNDHSRDAETEINSLLTNMGTKIFFGADDSVSGRYLQSISPTIKSERTIQPGITAPDLSSLPVGAYYFKLPGRPLGYQSAGEPVLIEPVFSQMSLEPLDSVEKGSINVLCKQKVDLKKIIESSSAAGRVNHFREDTMLFQVDKAQVAQAIQNIYTRGYNSKAAFKLKNYLLALYTEDDESTSKGTKRKTASIERSLRLRTESNEGGKSNNGSVCELISAAPSRSFLVLEKNSNLEIEMTRASLPSDARFISTIDLSNLEPWEFTGIPLSETEKPSQGLFLSTILGVNGARCDGLVLLNVDRCSPRIFDLLSEVMNAKSTNPNHYRFHDRSLGLDFEFPAERIVFTAQNLDAIPAFIRRYLEVQTQSSDAPTHNDTLD